MTTFTIQSIVTVIVTIIKTYFKGVKNAKIIRQVDRAKIVSRETLEK